FKRVPSLPSWLGVALAVSGLFILTGVGVASSRGTLQGDLLTLGGAFAFAVHITLTTFFAPKTRVPSMVAIQLWVVAFFASVSLPFVERRLTPATDFWLAVLNTGVLGSAAAISVQSWAQARTSAVRAAIIYALEPVFASLCSVLLGREQLGASDVWGGMLV